MELSLTELINNKLINRNFDGTTKKEVLEEIVRMVNKDKRLDSKDLYYKKILEREEEFTTGVGYGIAIPHAKTRAVIKPTIVILKLSDPIDWEALDDKPVDLVIGLAVPEKESNNTHLKIISKLSMKLMEEDFRQSLKNAQSDNEVLDLMEDIFYKN
ncbi:PTS sugar transporter subunit IIA [Clostridium sp. D2Q-14]|uniref:PTS sugar transporter subunit IIA n=1 Tax=Anaeromonas gelatinilytica TaxID=2683194 RepID=UPI00193B9C17|nr:PTS sugar transporter subunit IIA [Anaeromonas gelatinilytica]MBS4536775.1 PTS sugar transporter subunit IIA [Anaeromonas gelatinilytica]